MTDELSIQQKRPSATPYVLGGGLVGGLAGGFGLPATETTKKWISDPAKYKSFEELVKESSDNDKFEKAISEATDSQKILMEKVKGYDEAKIIKDAEDAWQKEFDAFKADKKVALPADHDLMTEKAQAEEAKKVAQEALDKKIAALEKAEADRLAKACADIDPIAVKELQTKINEATTDLNQKNKGFNRVIDNLAKNRYAEIERGGANIEAIEKKQNELLKQKVREFTGANKDALFADDVAVIEKEIAGIDEQIKKATSKLERITLEDKRNELTREIKSNRVSSEAESLLTEAKNAVQNRIAIKEIEAVKVPAYSFGKTKKSAEKALQEFCENNKGFTERVEAFIKEPNLDANKAFMERLVKAENLKLDKVKHFQKILEEFSKTAKPEEAKEVEYLVNAMIGGKEIKGAGFKIVKTEKVKELKGAFDSLSKEEVATLKRLVGDNPNAENLGNAIKRIEKNIADIKTSTTTLSNLQAEIEKVAGKGAKLLENGTLVDAKGKKVVAKMAVPESLRAEVSLPESRRLKGLRKSLEQTKNADGSIVENAAAKAKENVAKDPSKFATESNALKEATTRVDDVAKKIAKEAGKLGNNVDEKSLIEEFAKTGKGTKAEAGQKAINSFKDEVKALYTETKNNKKFWLGVAALTAVGALLGLALRPKSKEQV